MSTLSLQQLLRTQVKLLASEYIFIGTPDLTFAANNIIEAAFEHVWFISDSDAVLPELDHLKHNLDFIISLDCLARLFLFPKIHSYHLNHNKLFLERCFVVG